MSLQRPRQLILIVMRQEFCAAKRGNLFENEGTAMRETIGSMRAYLILVGIFGGAQSILVLLDRSIFGVYPPNPLAMKVSAGINLAFALAFVFSGIFLRKLLRDLPGSLIALFCVTAVLQILTAIVLLSIVGQPSVLVVPGIALIISVYLLVNVRRLSAAEQPQEGRPLTHVEEDAVADRGRGK